MSINENKKSRKTLMQWLKSRKGQQFTIIVLFSTVPLLLLFTFTYLPLFKMFQFSFYKMKYIGKRTFVGWDNYIKVFTDKELFASLKLSIYYVLGSFIQLALALYFATILSFKTKCGNFFKGAIFFPVLINGIAIGFIFKFFYTRGFVLDSVLQFIGFDLENLPYWLRDQRINNFSLAGSSVWRWYGQNMVLFIGAIMSVDSEMYEAASLDGANRWHQFKYIILPSIKTIVMLNLILSVTGSLSAFEPSYVISAGANGTATYFVKMNETAHTNQQVGLASAMAIILLAIIMVVTLLQKLFFKYVWQSDSDVDYRRRKKEEKYHQMEVSKHEAAK